MFNTTKKIVINLAVLVGTLVICFIVAEIGVRVAEVNIPQVQGYTITLDNAWGVRRQNLLDRSDSSLREYPVHQLS
jgi:hypothetical protein